MIRSLIFLLLSYGFVAQAQEFTRIGGGILFNAGIDETYRVDINTREFILGAKPGNTGIWGRGVLELTDDFYAVPRISFFLPKKVNVGAEGDRTTVLAGLDLDLTYAIAKEGELMFYALAGLSTAYMHNKYEGSNPHLESTSVFNLGANIGTGVEMIVNRDITGTAQLHYTIGKLQYLVISIGANYYISGNRRGSRW